MKQALIFSLFLAGCYPTLPEWDDIYTYESDAGFTGYLAFQEGLEGVDDSVHVINAIKADLMAWREIRGETEYQELIPCYEKMLVVITDDDTFHQNKPLPTTGIAFSHKYYKTTQGDFYPVLIENSQYRNSSRAVVAALIAHEFIHVATYCFGGRDNHHASPDLWCRYTTPAVECRAAQIIEENYSACETCEIELR